MHCVRGESGKETLWSKTMNKQLRRWTDQKSTPEGSERWKFCIPSRRWNSQNPWGRSRPETIHLNQGSPRPRRRTRSFSRRIRRTLLQTLFKMTQHAMMQKLKNDFWSITEDFIYRHHVEPRVKLYMPKEAVEVHRRYQNNTYVTGCTDWWLLERWWRERIVRCMDKLQKIHLIKREATWRMYTVRWETDEETDNLKTRQSMARYVEAYVWCSEKQIKTKMGYRETKAR